MQLPDISKNTLFCRCSDYIRTQIRLTFFSGDTQRVPSKRQSSYTYNLFDLVFEQKKSNDPVYFPSLNMLVPFAYFLCRNQRPWQRVQFNWEATFVAPNFFWAIWTIITTCQMSNWCAYVKWGGWFLTGLWLIHTGRASCRWTWEKPSRYFNIFIKQNTQVFNSFRTSDGAKANLLDHDVVDCPGTTWYMVQLGEQIAAASHAIGLMRQNACLK